MVGSAVGFFLPDTPFFCMQLLSRVGENVNNTSIKSDEPCNVIVFGATHVSSVART